VQYATCAIGDALVTRLKAVELIRTMLAEQPNDPATRQRLAYRLAGVAGLKEQLGLDAQALEDYEEAEEIFRDLSRFDPGNPQYRWSGLVWQVYVERLRADGNEAMGLGRLERSVDAMTAMMSEQQQVSPRMEGDYAAALLQFVAVATRAGDEPRAREALARALERLEAAVRDHPGDRSFVQQLSLATFLAWERGLDHAQALALLEPMQASAGDDGPVNCTIAPFEARMAILRGERQRAERLTAALLEKGYWDREFVPFCRRYDLCPEP